LRYRKDDSSLDLFLDAMHAATKQTYLSRNFHREDALLCPGELPTVKFIDFLVEQTISLVELPVHGDAARRGGLLRSSCSSSAPDLFE